jgi:hypothetical protein
MFFVVVNGVISYSEVFDENKKLVTASNKTLLIWSLETGEELYEFSGYTGTIKTLGVSDKY